MPRIVSSRTRLATALVVVASLFAAPGVGAASAAVHHGKGGSHRTAARHARKASSHRRTSAHRRAPKSKPVVGRTYPVGPRTIDGLKVLRTITLIATAYGPSAQDNYPYPPLNALGRKLFFGGVAVDPSVIPLGTKLYIRGYADQNLPTGGFLAVADDTGGAIQGDRIDIFMPQNARIVSDFGVQRVTAYILGK